MAVVFDGKCLFLLIMFTCISRCQTQNCSSNLTNTVAYEGSPASFKRVNSSKLVKWVIYSSSDYFYNASRFRLITDFRGDVEAVVTDRYAISATELKINKSTVTEMPSLYPSHSYATAGLYVLTYQDPENCTYGANLIVIRSGPVCSYNASDPNNVKLVCSVDFAESGVQPNYPVFTWKNSTSVVKQQQPVPSQLSTYLNKSTSEFVIDGNDATRYECQLTFSSTPNSPFNYVTSTAPDFTASCFSSSDVFVVPTYGPAAGGTVVTIVAKWTSLPITISAVYIGPNLNASINHTSTENIVVTTPKIENELQINQHLPFILEISQNSTNITTGNYFTYKPNPRINDVIPKDLPISGGIRLNITGTNLDSVAQPLVRAQVVIRRGNVITYNNQSFSPCFQPTQNGTQMICLSPPIYIRDDFLLQLFGQTNPYNNSRRKRETILSYGWKREDKVMLHDSALPSIRSKRSTSISTNQTYNLTGSEDTLQIYVGIVFDGFKVYENNIRKDSGGSFSLCYPPTLSCDGDMQFKDNFITIQGNNMTQCYRPSDYNVIIGDGFCTVKDLTDNTLTCYPPEKKPQQTENDRKYDCGKDFAVIVKLGFKEYRCSCLKYPNDDHMKLIIIIAATVGSVVVVLVIITVIVVVVRKYKKAKDQDFHHELERIRWEKIVIRSTIISCETTNDQHPNPNMITASPTLGKSTPSTLAQPPEDPTQNNYLAALRQIRCLVKTIIKMHMSQVTMRRPLADVQIITCIGVIDANRIN